MKNLLDTFYGGEITSRQAMQNRMRNMVVTGNVIQETEAAIAKRTAAEQVSSAVEFNKERKWQVVQSEKSAPYVGERY